MAQTACPFCAYSPIRPGAEACPRCERRFVQDVLDDGEATATRAGGITGAVTASPAPIAAALLVGAVAWFLRVLDVLTPLREPALLLVVPALLVAGAASVMAAAGPAKHVPAGLGVLCLAAAGLWTTPHWLPTAGFAGFGVLLIIATVSEPSSLRLKGGAALASLAALVGLLALAVPTARRLDAPQVASLKDERVGLRWELPAGWRDLERLERLAPPDATPRRAVLRATNGDGTEAFLVLDREIAADGCARLLADLGTGVVKTPDEAPLPFPRGTPVLEVKQDVGAVRAACGVGPSGLVAIVVSATGPASIVEATLRVLASGAVVTADPAGP
ncbi:MAG: hypothetical protein IAE78_26595 [Myxococcus sp.]|nr:hypothetical protein [Myxococcus sp.]